MAKMFYSLEEAAERLGVDEERVKDMAAEGKLQQFRDRDKLMFKREQVDALSDYQPTGLSGLAEAAGGADSGPPDSGPIPLADPLDDTDTDVINVVRGGSQAPDVQPVDESLEDTGMGMSAVSVFDADEVEPADPMAKTHVTSHDDDEIALENVGSGSGLLDLTRESDDTSLGAELLEEIYPGSGGEGSDYKMEQGPSASGVFDGTLLLGEHGGSTGLDHLQGSGEPSPALATAPISLPDEAPDPAGNGLASGLLLGATVTLVIALIVAVFAVRGVPSSVTAAIADSPGMYLAILLVASLLLGVGGFVLGKTQQTA